MIKLTDNLYVAADQVAEISIVENHDWLHVRMKDGRVHGVGCDYGKSAWATLDRLVRLVEAAQSDG